MDGDIRDKVSLWLRGDVETFREIFAWYYPRLYRYALRYLKNEVLAEDLAMEVLARVWEKRAVIREETFENYLFTAARHRLINHWQRKIEVLLSLESVQENGSDSVPGGPALSEDPVLAKELENIYRDSVSALPAQRRLIFHLHRHEQLSYKEIAARLKISPKTVENQLGAALKQLRLAMSQYLNSIIL